MNLEYILEALIKAFKRADRQAYRQGKPRLRGFVTVDNVLVGYEASPDYSGFEWNKRWERTKEPGITILVEQYAGGVWLEVFSERWEQSNHLNYEEAVEALMFLLLRFALKDVN